MPTGSGARWTVIRKLLAALAIFGMLASGIGIASFVIFNNPAQQAVAPVRTPPPPPPPSVPTSDEFVVGVVVTDQNCDPAGACLYTYTIDPEYVGLHPFPDTAFTVDYEIVGGHQPQPGSFIVEGEKAQILKDVTVEGPPGAQLQANVLRVFDGTPPGVDLPPNPEPGANPPPEAGSPPEANPPA